MHPDDLFRLAVTIARLLGTSIDDDQLDALKEAVNDVGLLDLPALQNRLDARLAAKGRDWGDQDAHAAALEARAAQHDA